MNEVKRRLLYTAAVDGDTSPAGVLPPSDPAWWWMSLNMEVLPVSSLLAYRDYLNWTVISHSASLSEELLELAEDLLDWTVVSRGVQMTASLLDKFSFRWDWSEVSANRSMTPEALWLHRDKVHWGMVNGPWYRSCPVSLAEVIDGMNDSDRWMQAMGRGNR